MNGIRRLGVVVAGFAAVFGMGLVGTASADDAGPGVAQVIVADGSDPIATGCANDAFTARQEFGKIAGVDRVLVELRYSPRCRTAWARVTTVNMPNCVTGVDYCGGAVVHRNSDGREYYCTVPNGGHGCYSRQVNDNQVTSYAHGHADYHGRTAYATTTSY